MSSSIQLWHQNETTSSVARFYYFCTRNHWCSMLKVGTNCPICAEMIVVKWLQTEVQKSFFFDRIEIFANRVLKKRHILGFCFSFKILLKIALIFVIAYAPTMSEWTRESRRLKSWFCGKPYFWISWIKIDFWKSIWHTSSFRLRKYTTPTA